MEVTLTRLSRAACLLLLAAASVRGQTGDASWSVTLKPTMNPLPIGSCGPVWLTLLDAAGKSAPRNPSGAYVTIADFDLKVTSDDPRAVVGKYDGASSWSACACQAAKVGSSATVTATYPAKALPENARVPGIKIQKSAVFTMKAPMGEQEPSGCDELTSAAPIAAKPASPMAMAMATATAPNASSKPPIGMAGPLPADVSFTGGIDALLTVDGAVLKVRHLAGGSLSSRNGNVSVDPIVVDAIPSASLATLANAAWNVMTPPPKNGTLVDMTSNATNATTLAGGLGQLAFGDAALASVVFPTIDAAIKDASNVRLIFSPRTVSSLQNSPSITASAKPATWMAFRLSVGTLERTSIARIESFTVGGEFSPDASGVYRDNGLHRAQGGKFPNLIITMSAAQSPGWLAWYDDVVVKGNAVTANEKTLTLELQDVSGATLMTLTGAGVGIVSLRMLPPKDGHQLMRAEIYVQRMDLIAGAPAAQRP